MKKYLIDQDQMTYLLRILRCYPLMHEELKKLKPIEQLSDKAIFEIVNNSAFVEGKYMLPFSFAREIEAHIIGGTP